MSHEFATLTTLLLGIALTWIVQSTVLLASGLLAGRLVKNSGPAVQSAVYRTTLAAVLVCPIATALLTWAGFDGFNLRLPPPRLQESAEKKLGAELPKPLIDKALPTLRFEPGLELFSSIAETSPQPEPPVQPAPAVEPRIVETPPTSIHLSNLTPIAGLASAVWLIGSGVLTVRLLIGQRRMARLRSAAFPVEAEVQTLCCEVADRFQVTAPSVLRSPFLFSPCLDGIRKPVILLPDDVADNLRETFTHELAHLARRDVLWNLLRRSASVILWIQPLLWMLSRRLEATAEEVCDDYVVQHGADRARYAGHLVTMAGRALPPTTLSGVGILSLRSLLGQRVVRILDSSRSLSTRAGRRAVAAALIAGIAGTLFAGLLGVSGARKEVKAASPKVEASKPDAEEKADDDRTVHGQVIDPDGEPVPGATVYLTPAYGYLRKPNASVVSTTAGADGRFIIEVPKTREFERSRIVSAGAPGFGVGWVKTMPGDRLDNLRLQLEVDDAPIEGQIVDLEGVPIVGASLWVIQINASPLNDLGPWLAAVERKEGDGWELEHRYLPRYTLEPSITVMTGAEGRFRITGIGRNRVAWLQLEGPKVVSQHLRVLTRPGKAEEVPHGGDHENGEPLVATTYFGASFRHAAAPTRPIVGVVRDADTQKPLAGVPIRSRTLATRPNHLDDIAQTVTDAEGRFRLAGMPKGKGNTIVAVPAEDQPYAPCVKEVPDGPGLAPVSLEIELRRGVWIEGRITDKTTGKPVAGSVEYFAHSKNPSLADYPDFDGSAFSHHHPVREDGSYRIAGLPGPGLVAVLRRDDYLSAPERDDEFGTKQQELSTAPYHLGFTSNYSALAEVDPPKGSQSLRRDVTLDPGSTFRGIVLGPDGKPMAGARSWDVDSLEPMRTAEFTVSGMNPKEPPRDLVFLHPERGLVGIARAPQEKGSSVTVRMRTGAMATGRLVDSQGQPRPGMQMRLAYRTPDQARWRGYPNELVETDTQGRFTIKALVPEYTFQLREGKINDGPTFGGSLRAGELIDIGDVRIEPAKAERPQATERALQPSDQPKSTADAKPADVPVLGRVVDLEGRPVPGVRVKIEGYRCPKSGNLDEWLAGVKTGSPPWVTADLIDWKKRIPENATKVAVTDEDGRFRLEGVGAERNVELELRGDTIALNRIEVVTRRMAPLPAPGFGNQYGPGSQTVYGAEFTYAAAPCRPIEGVVKDSKTGEPLPGVEVRSTSFAGSNWIGTMALRVKSDAQGKFRLLGMPKGKNRLLAVPNDEQPYFLHRIDVPDSPGAGPVQIEVGLTRGLWIEGKLTEEGTDKPVAEARLFYAPFLENTFAQAAPEFGKDRNVDGVEYQDRYLSKTDGSFRFVGLPGRALVGALAVNKEYMVGAGYESIKGLGKEGYFETYRNPVPWGRNNPTVMKEINPPSDARVTHVDLQVRSGDSVRYRVLDPEGNPAAGTAQIGLTSRGAYSRDRKDLAEGVVRDLYPGEERTVMFRDEPRKLGKVIRVRKGDDAGGPVVVTLEPLATITGRVSDADGNPVSGATIRPDLLPSGDFSPQLSQVSAGPDGRFTVSDVPAGCEYSLGVESSNQLPKRRSAFSGRLTIRPGATTNAGEIRFKD